MGRPSLELPKRTESRLRISGGTRRAESLLKYDGQLAWRSAMYRLGDAPSAFRNMVTKLGTRS